MKSLFVAILAGFLASPALAHSTSYKTETVEEQPRTDTKVFCGKTNADEANKLCADWLNRQLKTLGDKVLTSTCSAGDMTTDTNCLYRAQGEVTYSLKKYRIETERH